MATVAFILLSIWYIIAIVISVCIGRYKKKEAIKKAKKDKAKDTEKQDSGNDAGEDTAELESLS